MKISTDSWHFKVYGFWFKDKFGASYADYVAAWGEPNTNLCPYVRAVLLWGPLRYIFTPPRAFITFGAIYLALVAVATRIYGWHGLKVAILVTLISSLGVLLFLATIIAALKLSEYIRKTEFKKPEKLAGFFDVLLGRARAAHDGVCPVISIVNPDGSPLVQVENISGVYGS